ncbi:MAG: hypothetical protein ACKVVT_18020 [Dehalococcoidia bacterium]
MKLLRLGSSQDAPGRVPPEYSLEHLIREGLSRELGEPVEVLTKPIWPTARLPELVRGWMTDFQPDFVRMGVVGYWFMYESVPLKLQRRFGRPGQAVGDAGKRATEVPWIAHNAAFRFGRRVAQRTIGGATPFSAEQVVACVTATLSEVVRHEGVMVQLRGPDGRARIGDYSKSAIDRMELRRKDVTGQLAALCARHHVTFVGYDEPRWRAGTAPPRSGDGIHAGIEGNVAEAAEVIREIASQVQRERPEHASARV